MRRITIRGERPRCTTAASGTQEQVDVVGLAASIAGVRRIGEPGPDAAVGVDGVACRRRRDVERGGAPRAACSASIAIRCLATPRPRCARPTNMTARSIVRSSPPTGRTSSAARPTSAAPSHAPTTTPPARTTSCSRSTSPRRDPGASRTRRRVPRRSAARRARRRSGRRSTRTGRSSRARRARPRPAPARSARAPPQPAAWASISSHTSSSVRIALTATGHPA